MVLFFILCIAVVALCVCADTFNRWFTIPAAICAALAFISLFML